MQYGIRSAPTFILLDKKGGSVYYCEVFKKKDLIKAIEDNI
jgi:thioredoxin-related protein